MLPPAMTDPANANGDGNGTGNDESLGVTAEHEAAPGGEPAASEAKPEPPAKDPLDEAKADAARFREQLLRTAADFENYRKRARRDVDEATRKGSEDMLKNLLPVFDNLERAAAHAEQAMDAKAIAEGVRMVLRQFVDTLARTGVQRIGGVGGAFDPMVHEAVQQLETTEAKPGTVIAEVAPGYKIGDKLLRAALVVVAKAPSAPSKPPPGETPAG
ncbi:MAG: hypothetical protein NVS3B10_30100 [Polyangiales bacterium]